MSIEHKRWAQRAQELRLQQLSIVRKQAEAWRAGLAGLTGLLGVVLVVKGRDTLTGLDAWARVTVALLLVSAFTGLLTATVLAVRAAAGTPGAEILLTGEGLRDWTRREVRAVGRRIWWAALLTLAALALLVTAVGLTWFGPITGSTKPVVQIVSRDETICGELVGSSDGEMIIKGEGVKRVPLHRIVSIDPAGTCSQP